MIKVEVEEEGHFYNVLKYSDERQDSQDLIYYVMWDNGKMYLTYFDGTPRFAGELLSIDG